MKALSEACDQCYAADKLCAQEVCGAILSLDQIPSVVQIHKWDLFKLGAPGNHVMDDIHLHWESYFQRYGVLADAPYSKFQATEGWDTVYTWDSLEKHEPELTHTYGKKVTKPSLTVVVAPTITEIGDDYFLNKLPSLLVSRKGQSITVLRWLGKGVTCKWSFVPSVECCLRTLLLAAPTFRATWDLLLPAGAADSSTQRLPRSSKSTLESSTRHKPQK